VYTKFMLWNIKLAIAVGGIVACGNIASAEQPASTPSAKPDIACLQIPAKLGDSELQSFMSDPKALLTANQVGGLPLSNRIRELAGSSSHAFDKIMELTKEANSSQKAAIASGLARVVFTCGNVGTDATQNYAASIQTSVAGFGDPEFASTFLEASKEVNVASVGPGAAGFSVGGGATDGGTGKFSGDNKYKSPGDGPNVTTSGAYTFGSTNPFGASSDNLSPI